MDDAVGDAPGLHRVGVVFHAKCPAVEIRAVEKFDVAGRSDDILRADDLSQCESEAKRNGGGFHAPENAAVAGASQARG